MRRGGLFATHLPHARAHHGAASSAVEGGRGRGLREGLWRAASLHTSPSADSRSTEAKVASARVAYETRYLASAVSVIEYLRSHRKASVVISGHQERRQRHRVREGEAGEATGAIKCNQVQSSTIKRNQAQSSAIKCNQVQSST